jgi:cytochrome c peroxidase
MKRLPLIITFVFMTLYAGAITPIPQNIDVNILKAQLGKDLFLDTRLSKNNTIACINCHNIYENGANITRFSFGINGTEGELNTPTVFNSHFNFVQTYSGSAKNLAEQVHIPISNPIEMNSSMDEVVKKLRKIPELVVKFGDVYRDGLNEKNIADAIAEFEKALTTPNSPFDRYLRGESDAITQTQKDGYDLFQKFGCVSCHNGMNVGGNMYQKLGLMLPYTSKVSSKGRYNVTKRERDLYLFKVPSLRNIELTSPYLHDGSKESLDQVVKDMARHQLGVILSDDEVSKIASFLCSLTGEKPKILEELK